MNPGSRTSYDAVRYPSCAHPQTHPDQLAVKALLFGLTPPALETCRVLELGCGDGTNLVSFGLGLPEATFVGVDLAEQAIARGHEIVASLGLRNVSLRAGSVMDIGADFGQFDYIIAHGLYSWVPQTVRDKVMAMCQANLAPQGVAQISYNVHPGGHLREMIRGMMLYHTRDFTTPEKRVNQGIALIKFLGESKPEPDTYRRFLQEQFAYLSGREPSIVYHDDLSPEFHPVWFHEFCRHAAEHGLQFLAESDYLDVEEGGYTPGIAQVLRQLSGDRQAREQYSDFLSFRRFRQSLICHSGIRLRFGLSPEQLSHFHVSSAARPVAADFEPQSDRAERFMGDRESGFSLTDPFAKTAMAILAAVWPQSMPFQDLVGTTRERLGRKEGEAKPDAEARGLFELLLRIYVPGLVTLHLAPPRFAAEAGERPVATALARWQARESRDVTNLRHVSVVLEDDVERKILQQLDGSRDRAMLQAEVPELGESLHAMLDRFARTALLIGG